MAGGGGEMRLLQRFDGGRSQCHEIRGKENVLAIEKDIEVILQGGVTDHCAAMKEKVLNPKEIIVREGLVVCGECVAKENGRG
jgi:hypothetical protein